MWCNLCQKEIGKRYPVEAILLPDYGNSQRRTQTPSKSLKTSIFRFCEIYWEYARSSKSIKIGINLSIDKSIKIGKSDLIDIDCIDQSVEIDDTLVSFIDLSRFYRFHRFLSEDTSVLLFIQKWKLISCKQWICWQLSCKWESKDQTIYYHFSKKVLKNLIFSLKPTLKSSSDGR